MATFPSRVGLKPNMFARPNLWASVCSDSPLRLRRETRILPRGSSIAACEYEMTYRHAEILQDQLKPALPALDYAFIQNPAFNRDRGPVHVIGARLHWDF